MSEAKKQILAEMKAKLAEKEPMLEAMLEEVKQTAVPSERLSDRDSGFMDRYAKYVSGVTPATIRWNGVIAKKRKMRRY